MDAQNKRARLCLVLFGIALGFAIAFSALGVLLAYLKNYAPAIVLAAAALVCFYAAPFYYNSAATSKAFAKILASLNDGAETLDELSEKTGIRHDACEKLFLKAISRGIIAGFELKDSTIIRK